MNKTMIKKRGYLLAALLVIMAVSAAAEVQYYYKIGLTYNQGNISYTTLSVVPSEKALDTPGANYIAELIGPDNKTLTWKLFGISTELLYDIVNPETGEIIGGGIRQLNESEATLYLPYDESAQRINIYNLNLTKKLTIPVAELAKAGTIPVEVEKVLPEAVPREEAPLVTPMQQVVNGVLIGLGIIMVLTMLVLLLRRRKRKA